MMKDAELMWDLLKKVVALLEDENLSLAEAVDRLEDKYGMNPDVVVGLFAGTVMGLAVGKALWEPKGPP